VLYSVRITMCLETGNERIRERTCGRGKKLCVQETERAGFKKYQFSHGKQRYTKKIDDKQHIVLN
jgi:hypothetical protein